ncbi:hypothetical protein PF008_g18888 [Phytophthora fragariae]|uniref:Secreted protein n=1 Tax=Phytophthora fragariae TaxID=53985 RepID=A0A6G0R404_9STRA|nr:hypothetical protein PF008_g18888 [Phytophthora fragariae]
MLIRHRELFCLFCRLSCMVHGHTLLLLETSAYGPDLARPNSNVLQPRTTSGGSLGSDNGSVRGHPRDIMEI